MVTGLPFLNRIIESGAREEEEEEEEGWFPPPPAPPVDERERFIQGAKEM